MTIVAAERLHVGYAIVMLEGEEGFKFEYLVTCLVFRCCCSFNYPVFNRDAMMPVGAQALEMA